MNFTFTAHFQMVANETEEKKSKEKRVLENKIYFKESRNDKGTNEEEKRYADM